MKNKLVPTLLAALVATVAVACADGPSAPLTSREPSSPSLLVGTTATTTTQTVDAVLWKSARTKPASATALIGPEGGELVLNATGLRLIVPAGAVKAPTQFSVAARIGQVVAYDFQPEGTHFAVPLRFEQDQKQLARPQTAPGQNPVLRLGYVRGASDIDETHGRAQVAEQNDMLPSQNATSYAFPVHHFSGYIVSWGRK